jgi:hypothetical protein
MAMASVVAAGMRIRLFCRAQGRARPDSLLGPLMPGGGGDRVDTSAVAELNLAFQG